MLAVSDRPISAAQVAKELLNRSPAWFYIHRPDLEQAGFPKPIPVHGGYLPSKVRAWLDSSQSGEAKSTEFQEGLERLLSGQRRKRPAA